MIDPAQQYPGVVFLFPVLADIHLFSQMHISS